MARRPAASGNVSGNEPGAGNARDQTGSVLPGTLYVVSTPIGNLADITLRALEVLRGVNVVLAEDTRHTRILFQRHQIDTRLLSLHEHNEARATAGIVARLTRGESAAVVSDAGTPLISDPGARLVRAVWEAGLRAVPVPGPAAVLAALAAAGVETTPFTFFGFLPRSGQARSSALRQLSVMSHTSVIYESPERVGRTLVDLVELGCGERQVVVARELTKRFEEFVRGTTASLATYYASTAPRGEVVVIIEGRREEKADEMKLRERARAMRQTGAGAREIMQALVEEPGVSRNLAYRLAHEA